MSIYAIGDLHLATSVPDKSMDVFGGKWLRHDEKIQNNWNNIIRMNDIVLVPGDISWAMNIEEVKSDLEWIDRLPGKKIMIKGNHDFWWNSITKVRNILPNSIKAIQNDCIELDEFVVTGTRGWLSPESRSFTEKDRKIYERELIRLKLGLDSAKRYEKPIIVMMHFPPVGENGFKTCFVELFEMYQVICVCYGHLHGTAINNGFNGNIDGISYYLVSGDAVDFYPVMIR